MQRRDKPRSEQSEEEYYSPSPSPDARGDTSLNDWVNETNISSRSGGKKKKKKKKKRNRSILDLEMSALHPILEESPSMERGEGSENNTQVKHISRE